MVNKGQYRALSAIWVVTALALPISFFVRAALHCLRLFCAMSALVLPMLPCGRALRFRFIVGSSMRSSCPRLASAERRCPISGCMCCSALVRRWCPNKGRGVCSEWHPARCTKLRATSSLLCFSLQLHATRLFVQTHVSLLLLYPRLSDFMCCFAGWRMRDASMLSSWMVIRALVP